MKQYILAIAILVVTINSSGCVGSSLTHNSDIKVSNDISALSWQFRTKPTRKPDKVLPGGLESYVVQDELKWCGLTVFAIIPIPLWMPVCNTKLEVTYNDGKPVQFTRQMPVSSGAYCGPLVPMLGIGGGGHGFCRAGTE